MCKPKVAAVVRAVPAIRLRRLELLNGELAREDDPVGEDVVSAVPDVLEDGPIVRVATRPVAVSGVFPPSGCSVFITQLHTEIGPFAKG